MILRKSELQKLYDDFMDLYADYRDANYNGHRYIGNDHELDRNYEIYKNDLQELVWSAQNGVNVDELYEIYTKADFIFIRKAK